MKIDIVSCVFKPEPIISARTSADLAQQLAREGHRVRVIAAFPNRPAGKVFEGYRRSLWAWDRSFKGYQVLRVFSLLSRESSLLSRFLENISFAISSSLAMLFLDRPDAVYANVWPIFAQGLLALVCHIRGIPLVLSVQDVYPESLSTLSRLGNRDGRLFRLFRWIDRKTKQSCEAVIVISTKFRQIYVRDRKVAPEKVHIIPNWTDEGTVDVSHVGEDIRRQHGIPGDAFVVVYAGNIGAACGLDSVIEAFGGLAPKRHIHLLVAGSGSMLGDAQALAAKIGNPRVHFHTPWLAAETSSVLAAADLFILPTYGDQSLVSVPSKLITYMLAARPILCCADDTSDIAKTVRSAACGWSIPSGDPETTARMIVALSYESSRDLRRFGRQGREYALRHMTTGAVLPRLVELMLGVGRRGRESNRMVEGAREEMAKQ
jgi:glycosyltransferase involved in cell wall biosynthesis